MIVRIILSYLKDFRPKFHYSYYIFIIIFLNTLIHEIGHTILLLLFKPNIKTVKSIRFYSYGLKGIVLSDQIQFLKPRQKQITYSAGFIFNLLFTIPYIIYFYNDFIYFFVFIIVFCLSILTFVTSLDFKFMINPYLEAKSETPSYKDIIQTLIETF